MDENIKQITEKFESKIKAEIGGELLKFKARGQYDKQLSEEKKSELIARVKKHINAEQLSELNGIIEMLSTTACGDSCKACAAECGKAA